MTPFETKASLDPTTANADLQHAFYAYRESNDERLAALERNGTVDVLVEEKHARLDRAVEEADAIVNGLRLKAQRPNLAGTEMSPHGDALARKAFSTYVRKGDASALHRLETKALSQGSDPDGGYLVPDETEAHVNAALKAISPIRALATVRQVSSSVFKKPYAVSGFGTGWVGETAVRPQTATSTIAELSFPTMELYAMPAATPALLEDAAVNIDEWIAEEVRDAFAQQEGTAFVTGDGVNKPKGFLSYTQVANSAWTWGNVGTISTGVAGAFPATHASDKLIDLIYAVNAGYRANGTFVMNRATQSAVRKLKDGDGNYLWAPSATAGDAATLMGFPIAESEDMPDIATDSAAIAFGDFRRGYLVVDRVGLRVLRDPYSAKPYVLFYTTKRVGGGIQDFAAIKLLKFSA
jgi:HK97 family phage major capsid protein